MKVHKNWVSCLLTIKQQPIISYLSLGDNVSFFVCRGKRGMFRKNATNLFSI
jgi:hypothetical protein